MRTPKPIDQHGASGMGRSDPPNRCDYIFTESDITPTLPSELEPADIIGKRCFLTYHLLLADNDGHHLHLCPEHATIILEREGDRWLVRDAWISDATP